MNDPEVIVQAAEMAKEILRDTRRQMLDEVAKAVFGWIAAVQKQSPDMPLEEIEALWFAREAPDEPA